MTIEEAIGLSKVAAEDMDAQDMPRFAQATRLGREALMRLNAMRGAADLECSDCRKALPGETQEDACTAKDS